MLNQSRSIRLSLLALVAAAGAAHADWTQTFVAANSPTLGYDKYGINASGSPAAPESIRLVDDSNGTTTFKLLGNEPGSDPATSTAVAVIPVPALRNISAGVLVNPDQRVSAGRIGSIIRFETAGLTGYASAIDYGSGELVLARLNIPAASFSVVANQPIPGFAANKSYFIKTVADGANISVKAYDAALGLTDSAAVATTGNGGVINPANDVVAASGLFVRADGQATPAVATYGSVFVETLWRETQFVGSGEDDLFWLNTDGSLWSWAMNDLTIDASSYFTTLPTGWTVPTSADFNDDGVADPVCFNAATGQSGVIVSNAGGAATWGPLPTLAANSWDLVGAGDFTSDGIPDILYYNRTSRVLWLRTIGRNISVTPALPVSRATTPFFTVPAGYSVQAVNDYNRDGENDILFRNTDGSNGYVTMDDTNVVGWQPIPFLEGDWRVVGLADLNDDSQTDLIWRNSDFQMFGWIMNRETLTSVVAFPSIGTGWTPSN